MTLNPEIVRRLLLDQAGGELPPDVDALLDAHLATDADARSEAEALSILTDAARRAMAGDTERRLPVFPRAAVEACLGARIAEDEPLDVADRRRGGSWRSAGRTDRDWTAGMRWTRRAVLAASIALAFWTGRRVAQSNVDTSHSAPAVAQASPEPMTAEGMWSLSQIRRSEADRPRPAAAVRWISPLSLPRIERL